MFIAGIQRSTPSQNCLEQLYDFALQLDAGIEVRRRGRHDTPSPQRQR
jgi:hypothetical protein